jgi:hypothetical protein
MKNVVFWMLRSVALVRFDVSEERITSIIRVNRIRKLGKTLAISSNGNRLLQLLVTSNAVPSFRILFTVMMEVLSSSETLLLTRAIRRNIPEYGILLSHQSEDLKA